MKKSHYSKIILFFALLIIMTIACNLPSSTTAPTGTTAPMEVQPVDEQPEQPQATNEQPAEQPADEVPTDTQEPTSTLSHVSYPNQGGASYWVIDPSNKNYGPEGRSIADAFTNNIMERELTAPDMAYKPYLDIIRADISITSPFIYVTIYIEQAPPQDTLAHFGVEFDGDLDGRGDWLVYGQVPNGTDWTVVGVSVYEDSNNDVGGPRPIYADGAVSGLDGYENMLFNQGYDTTDPDMAWIRRDPSNTDRVQIALKHSVIGSDDEFMWGAWTDEGPMEPGWFDYNDHFTEPQAGSPLSGSPDFPLNELYLVDNTCRWVYGFTPTGEEPGICDIPKPTATPTMTFTPTPEKTTIYRIRGTVFQDDDYDGILDGGEPGMSGYTVRLGSGACGSTGLMTTTSASDGSYAFTVSSPGTYCVSVDITLSDSGWHTKTGKQITVTITDSDKNGINFGFVQIPY